MLQGLVLAIQQGAEILREFDGRGDLLCQGMLNTLYSLTLFVQVAAIREIDAAIRAIFRSRRRLGGYDFLFNYRFSYRRLSRVELPWGLPRRRWRAVSFPEF